MSSRRTIFSFLRQLTLLVVLMWPGIWSPAGIVNTKHNLINSEYKPLGGAETNEICAYCHTPHGKKVSRPLWIESSPDDLPAYNTIDSFGRTATTSDESRGSVSLSCLSCHDGTQAHNITGPISLKDGRPGSPGSIGTINLEIGTKYNAQIIPEIDRADSHPTGIPYRGSYRYEGLADVPENAFVTGDPPAAHKPLVGFKPAEGSVIDQEPVWWLDTGGTGRQRTDIHLYTRYEEDGQPRPYVECSSCHDPHAETYMFLRLGDTQSTVCLACHDV